LLGQQVGITQLLHGDSISGSQLATVIAVGLLVAFLVTLVTAQVYRSERLAISA
jgi:sodium transport system permease protein